MCGVVKTIAAVQYVNQIYNIMDCASYIINPRLGKHKKNKTEHEKDTELKDLPDTLALLA